MAEMEEPIAVREIEESKAHSLEATPDIALEEIGAYRGRFGSTVVLNRHRCLGETLNADLCCPSRVRSRTCYFSATRRRQFLRSCTSELCRLFRSCVA